MKKKKIIFLMFGFLNKKVLNHLFREYRKEMDVIFEAWEHDWVPSPEKGVEIINLEDERRPISWVIKKYFEKIVFTPETRRFWEVVEAEQNCCLEFIGASKEEEEELKRLRRKIEFFSL